MRLMPPSPADRRVGRGARPRKSQRTREPIDCLSALAMAVEWAASIEPTRPSVYEQRGLVIA